MKAHASAKTRACTGDHVPLANEICDSSIVVVVGHCLTILPKSAAGVHSLALRLVALLIINHAGGNARHHVFGRLTCLSIKHASVSEYHAGSRLYLHPSARHPHPLAPCKIAIPFGIRRYS
jgi:hypothetical protein